MTGVQTCALPIFISLTGGGGTGAVAHATVVAGVITGIVIDSPGTGYTSSPTMYVSDAGGGTGVIVSDTSSATGALTALTSSTEGHILTIDASGIPTFAYLQGGSF